jgi:hypothetical protein
MVLSKRLHGEQAPEKKGVPLCSWCSSHTSPPHIPHNSLAMQWQYLHLGTGRILMRQSVINSFLLQVYILPLVAFTFFFSFSGRAALATQILDSRVLYLY